VATPRDSLSGSNPTLAAFLHLRNSIQVEKLPGYLIGKRDYDQQDGYNESLGRFNSSKPVPRACFRAEGEARWLEAQLKNDSTGGIYDYPKYGPLHPYIVSGLMFPGRAELYLMAFAEGRINDINGQIILTIPGKDQKVVLLSAFHNYIDSFVEAYLNWIYRYSHDPDIVKYLDSFVKHYEWDGFLLGKTKGRLLPWLAGVQSPLKTGSPDRVSLGAMVSCMANSYNLLHRLRWNIDQDLCE
jgi:hypothetical protein